MRKITVKDLCANIAEHWTEHHGKPKPDAKPGIYEKLLSLNRSGTVKQINKIIGNGSWTSLRCDECNKHVELVIEVGEEMGYESNTAHLCKECIKKAYELSCQED